jgi:DNA polymerase-3 subunit epsilon
MRWRQRSKITYTLNLKYLSRYVPDTRIHLEWLKTPRTWVGSRIEAIVWAQRLLESDAIVVDTETTGLLKKANVEVIELAAIDMSGKRIYQCLFRPRYKIPARVIDIHGITNERVRGQPSFAEQAEEIREALHGRTIVTFNARFDREVIRRTCRLHKIDDVEARWECAMHAFRAFSRSSYWLKLPYGSHRALADCRATRRLLLKMAKATA